jgi:hypothetical protein
VAADNQAMTCGGVPALTCNHTGLVHGAIATFNGGTPAVNQATLL